MQSVESLRFPVPSWVYEVIVSYMASAHCFTMQTANIFLHKHYLFHHRQVSQDVVRNQSTILNTYAAHVRRKIRQEHSLVPRSEIYHDGLIHNTCCPNFSFCGNLDSAYRLRLHGGLCITCSIYIGKLIFVRPSTPLQLCSVCQRLDNCLIRVNCKEHGMMCMDCLQQPWVYKGFRDIISLDYRVQHVHGMLEMMSRGGCLHQFLHSVYSDKVQSLSSTQQKLFWIQMDILSNCAICRHEKQFDTYQEQIDKGPPQSSRRKSI